MTGPCPLPPHRPGVRPARSPGTLRARVARATRVACLARQSGSESESASGVAPAPHRDFFLEISGTLRAPWEIQRPQPAIRRLVDAGAFDGCSVLDVGCCIGDNSIYIASHAKGVQLIGCDLVERALGVARRRAAEAELDIAFVQQDLVEGPLQGPLEGRQFDVVLDSCIYHCFAPGEERGAYVANLERLVKPGGRIIMLVFSDKEPGTDGPHRCSQADIRGSYPPPGWQVESIQGAIIESDPNIHNGAAKGYLSVIRKAPSPATA